MARHSNILFGAPSKSSITVEPVVVIPDMLSKNESLIDKFNVEKINGKLPKTATANQANVEKRKVCCKLSLNSFSIFVKINRTPIKMVINDDDKKL